MSKIGFGETFFAPRRTATLSRRGVLRAAGGTALAASVGGLGMLSPRRAGAATRQRPLADFLNAQGTIPGGLPILLVPNSIGWSPMAGDRLASIDYAGLATSFLASLGISLGTSIDGSVMERPLADGRAEVTVLLHTTNALALVVALPAFTSTLFGYLPTEIAADPARNRPTVGNSFMQIVFANPAPGAPLPDLIVALNGGAPPGFEFRTFSFWGTARGPLRAAFGVPEGTPGELVIAQTGLWTTAGTANPNSRVALDAYPAEMVDLHVVGR